MKTLIVDGFHVLSIQEIPIPAYKDCQALVKTLSCGVCNGTDMKLIHGTFKNFSTYPAALGHEGVGKVVEVGNKVRNLRVGDIVLLPFLEEKSGEIYSGWGAYSEYAVVGDAEAYIANGMGPGTPEFSEGYLAQTVIKPTDKVDPVGASMIITFREVLSAIRRFGFKPNENILIFGAGPVGLCFTKFSKLLGLKTVIAIDIDDEKIGFAKQMGADYAFNSQKCDIKTELKKMFPKGVDYVVDAVGINQLINQGMELVRYNGKICCYGISPKLGMDLDWSKAPYNWSLDFIQWPSKKEEGDAHAQIMAWINLGVLDPKDFISDIFDFEHIIDAFKLVEERKSSTKKIVIRY
ncbi:MAG: zinc-binding dehydrogenase [Spirochaetaceae bacterium]|jgi:threonine dehydrogenase-like Zn-dependent dehydrogenase|nr:zinc-binding dehydrogenase [Spirochaetaceae bacterium]